MATTFRLDPPETEAARTAMVDSQVRPNRVTDPRLIAAMRTLPREAFLPANLAARAYADDDVKLGRGRAMLAPMAIARLVQLAEIRHGERALVVGAGTGYGAALVEACGAAVTALEEDSALLALARPALAVLAPEVELVEGPLAAGWPAAAPYDLVFIEGEVGELPDAIAKQVNRTGRLVMVRGDEGKVGRAVVGRPSAGGLSILPAFDCMVTALPALRRSPGFVF